jgi:hypothetical protein
VKIYNLNTLIVQLLSFDEDWMNRVSWFGVKLVGKSHFWWAKRQTTEIDVSHVGKLKVAVIARLPKV